MNPKLQLRPSEVGAVRTLVCQEKEVAGTSGANLSESWRSRATQGHSSLNGAKSPRCQTCSCRIVCYSKGVMV